MHSKEYFSAVAGICSSIDHTTVNEMVESLLELRERQGRLFMIGVGGSAGNASHAVNDFRKLCGIETYAPTDNVSELSARANDEGWETIFSGWLKVSRFSANDALMVFSVGGGSEENQVSVNIIHAIKLAKETFAEMEAAQ